MAQLANLTINDGAATPLAHALVPISNTPPAWRDTVSSLPLVGQVNMQVSMKMDSGNGLNKVRLILAAPTVETIGTVGSNGYVAGPKVAFINKVNVDFILPSRGTVQNRKDLRTLLINALQNSQIIDTIDGVSLPF